MVKKTPKSHPKCRRSAFKRAIRHVNTIIFSSKRVRKFPEISSIFAYSKLSRCSFQGISGLKWKVMSVSRGPEGVKLGGPQKWNAQCQIR